MEDNPILLMGTTPVNKDGREDKGGKQLQWSTTKLKANDILFFLLLVISK